MRHLPLLCLLALTVALAPAFSAPVITWASDPVRPGETVLLLGEGWGDAPTVQVSRLPDDPPDLPGGPCAMPPSLPGSHLLFTTVTPLQVTAQSLKFVLPADRKPGIFACRVVSGDLKSGLVYLNAPDVWWMQGDQGHEASPGGWLRLCGKNLELQGRPQVWVGTMPLHGLSLAPDQADPWTLHVPLTGVAAGKYVVYLHNGCGGPDAWQYVGTLTVRPPLPLWPPTRYDVTTFGAVPNDLTDATPALQAALQKCAANGGGIVYFPRGRYIVNDTLTIPPHTLLLGEGRDLSELYWPDRPTPFPALIQGTNSFAIQDLALYGVNTKLCVAADLGSKPDAGHVWLTRVLIRQDNIFRVKDTPEVDARSHGNCVDAIRAGGDDVRVTDCDIYCSGRSIYLSKPRASIVANNRLSNGRGGWYCLSGCDGLIFENNRIIGGDEQATGGGLNCLDGSTYSQNVYFAHNTLGPFLGWDREAMTTDAGGGAYLGHVASADGVKLTLAADPTWRGKDWSGAGVYILNGTGAGQYRRIVSTDARTVTLDRPWLIAPDATSVVSITAHQGHYILADNDFSDATIAVQMYGISIDNIVAGNTSARAGGFHNMALNYYGWQPSWFVQYFDNEITEGNGYIGPLNEEDHVPHDSSFFVYGASNEITGPTARAAIFRRNKIASNGRFQVIAACQDVIFENNEIAKSDVGIEIPSTANGVLIRGNKMVDVKEPYTGEGMGKAYLHPAERLAANLREAHALLLADEQASKARGFRGTVNGKPMPPLSDWSAIYGRLEALRQRPAGDPATTALVQEQLVAALRDPFVENHTMGADELALLLGLQAGIQPSPALLDVLAKGGGGQAPVTVWASLAPWAPPATVGFLVGLGGIDGGSPQPLPTAPGETAHATSQVDAPPGTWGPRQAIALLSVKGAKWETSGAVGTQVGSGALRDWLLVGPFPNPAAAPLDNSYYPPEMRLDVAATYDTPAGKLAWKPVSLSADRLDFKPALSSPTGVAYAVAGLRAGAALPATLSVISSQGCRIYLNDALILTNPTSGQSQATVQLQPGDNLLLAQVTSAAGDWSLSAAVTPNSPVAPGGLLPIPAAELQTLSRLRPPPLPPATAAGGALLFPGDVAWKLFFSDDFHRGSLGPDWKVASGTWQPKNGMLCTSGGGLLELAHPLKPPFRLEYDVSSPGPTDMACAWMHDAEGWQSGYYFGVCADGGDVNKLMKNGEYVGTAPAPIPGAGKTHHVIAQVLPGRVQLIVDGKLSLDYRDPQPPTAPDTLTLYPWGDAQYGNVKVYTGN